MNIITSGQNFTVNTELKDFISEKTQQKLVHFADRIHKVSFSIVHQHIDYKVDCDITSDFGEFFATDTFKNATNAIEHVLDKVVAEIRKKHDKVVEKKHLK